MPGQLLQRQRMVTDRSLYITAEEVQKRDGGARTVLVDVRDDNDFNLYRIPGSIHVKLFAVRIKQFLRDKVLVLINEGSDYSSLERECRRLREAGFTVSILQGGLNYWQATGYPVEGDMVALRKVNLMSSGNALRETVYDRWVVLNVSKRKDRRIEGYFPGSVAIPFTRDDAFLGSVKSLLSRYKDASYSVLVVDDSNKSYPRVESVLTKAGFRNVFFLDGGLPAYEAELKNQAAYWKKENGNMVKTKKCPNCP